jgi:hypothetical protein
MGRKAAVMREKGVADTADLTVLQRCQWPRLAAQCTLRMASILEDLLEAVLDCLCTDHRMCLSASRRSPFRKCSFMMVHISVVVRKIL